MTATVNRKGHYPIPNTLNLCISLAQIGISIGLLIYSSHTQSALGFIVAVILFAFIMQTGFSLLHEAEHNKLHTSTWLNDGLGFLFAAMFPGSYQLLKVAHLNHHKVNRSDAELVDYYRPGEAPAQKKVMYYFLITGGVWISAPLLTLALALTPKTVLQRHFDNSKGAAAVYSSFIQKAGATRVRLETLATILFWVALWQVAGLSFWAVAVCYLAFAFSWSSQQYIYHVRTPRHLIQGAYDLRLWAPIEWLYLKFNYHLAHHQAVNVPWLYMNQVAQTAPDRCYLKAYRDLWAPPQPVAQAWPVEFQRNGPIPPREDAQPL